MAYTRVTEKKRIRIETNCIENPICLSWHNSLGGRSIWVFGRQNTRAIQTQVEGQYKSYEEDLETSIGSDEYTGKKTTPSLIIGGVIPIESMDGIEGLIESGKVEMLMNAETWETEGVVWQRVRVQPGSFIIKKASSKSKEIELVLLLPEINTPNE